MVGHCGRGDTGLLLHRYVQIKHSQWTTGDISCIWFTEHCACGPSQSVSGSCFGWDSERSQYYTWCQIQLGETVDDKEENGTLSGLNIQLIKFQPDIVQWLFDEKNADFMERDELESYILYVDQQITRIRTNTPVWYDLLPSLIPLFGS